MSGCTEYRSIQRTGEASHPYDVSVGDTVLLVTTDAQEFEFKITDISDTALYGEHLLIPFDKITSIKKKEIDEVKTAGAVGGTVLGLGVIWLVVLMLTATIVVFPS